MKVWVFVEGESDRIALETLWARWREAMRTSGWGIQIIQLANKSQYLRKIGPRAAEKLMGSNRDVVVGLPDLYPNREYASTPYKHADITELKQVQLSLVERSLSEDFRLSPVQAQTAMGRFLPSALKHDLEMLLLAARDALRTVLGTADSLGNWRRPVEDQDQTNPPKHIVEELFMAKKGRRYRDTVHARAVLEKVGDLKGIVYGASGQVECPIFKETMDWIVSETGVPAY